MSAVPSSKGITSTEPAIRLEGVNKWYGEFHVLKNLNLTVRQGERIVIVRR